MRQHRTAIERLHQKRKAERTAQLRRETAQRDFPVLKRPEKGSRVPRSSAGGVR